MRPLGSGGVLSTSITVFWAVGLATMASPALAEDAPSAHQDRLNEIVVTARRIQENQQKTPLSVIALTAEDLDALSLTSLRDLQGFVPNLTLAPQQNVGEGAGNIFIRGIGQEDFIAGSEPGVGTYLDGVYLASTRGAIFDLVDVERIEVLRGPQGTLFGKNSIGGAIQIVTAKPQTNRHVRVRVTLGSFERFDAGLVLNQPLSSQLLARLTLQSNRRDGFLRRLPPPFPLSQIPDLDLQAQGGEDTSFGRLQLRWLASEGLTIDLAGDATRKRNPQSAFHVETLRGAPGILPINLLISLGRLPGPTLDDLILPSNFYETLAANAQRADIDTRGLSLDISRDTGPGRLRLILAHRSQRTFFTMDGDGLWYDIASTEFHDSQRQSSAEAQYSGKFGVADITAGLFWLSDRTKSHPTDGLRANGTLYLCNCFYEPDGRPQLDTAKRRLTGESRAIYGQATFHLSRQLSATVGARFTHERKSVEGEVILIDPDTLLPTETVLDSGRAKDSWNAFTWRAGAEFQATRDVMLYASASKGFKSGGFNVRLANLPNLGLTPFAPETARTFEIGLRSEWFDRRLRLNATIFTGNYRNLQLRQQLIIDGNLTSRVDNAGLARIRGAEVEVEAVPSPRLNLRAAYGHIDGRYLEVSGVPGLTLDSDFQRTPRHSFAASLSYTAPLRDGSLSLNVNFTYRSKEQFQITAFAYDQPAYGLTSARLAWRPTNDRWSIALFGTNLTGRHYRVAGRGNATILGAPRQFGVQLETKFGNQ